MKEFWIFTPAFPHWINMYHAIMRGLPIAEKVLPTLPAAGEFARPGLPRAEIEITSEDFDDDCFQLNECTFVSEKMRRAMALAAPDIQYFDVDAGRSPSLPQSKQYQLMHIPVAEDISDPDHSDYVFLQRPDGFELFGPPNAIAFRADAEPAHEIFYDRFFKVVLCTDAFALRVLWAGCTGMRFLDPTYLDGAGTFFRTLRGVERAGNWDPAQNAFFPGELIREIP